MFPYEVFCKRKIIKIISRLDYDASDDDNNIDDDDDDDDVNDNVDDNQ